MNNLYQELFTNILQQVVGYQNGLTKLRYFRPDKATSA